MVPQKMILGKKARMSIFLISLVMVIAFLFPILAENGSEYLPVGAMVGIDGVSVGEEEKEVRFKNKD